MNLADLKYIEGLRLTKFQVIELFKIKKHRKLTVIRIDLKTISAYFYAIMNVIFEFWEKHLWSGLMHLVLLS